MLGKETDKHRSSVYDIYNIGEHIRSQMHKRPDLVKDRWYRLRKYRTCFLGVNAVDWLVQFCHAYDRGEAVMAMRVLGEYGVLHHVHGEQVFKDQGLLYRFSRDDETYLLRKDMVAFYRGLDLFKEVMKSGIRRDFYHRGHLYQAAFYGCDLVDLLVRTEDLKSRAEVVLKCREFLEYGIIRHVTDDYHFSDDRLMYQFAVDYDRPCLLRDTLHCPIAALGPAPTDSMARQQQQQQQEPNQQQESQQLQQGCQSSATAGSAAATLSATAETAISLLPEQPIQFRRPSSSVDQPMEGSSSSDEFKHSGGGRETGPVPMVKRVFKLEQDKVGYGLVLRGSSPCYIHTIDPLGPAAAAGLREGQYVLSVGGQNVKHKDHRYVGQLVMTSTGHLTIVVLTRKYQTPGP